MSASGKSIKLREICCKHKKILIDQERIKRNKVMNLLVKKNAGNVLALSIIVLFLFIGLIKMYPFHNQLSSILNAHGDDWSWYAKHGLDICHNGIFMPSVPGVYIGPAGFLYSYFLALCFLFFSENTIPVFLIQNLMASLSVALMYWAFRDKMRNATGIMFLAVMALFTFVDVYKYYACRFLSENLMFFTISLFFFCFIRGIEKNKATLQLLSAFLLGTTFITRPNMILFGFVLLSIIIVFYLRRKKILMVVFSIILLSSSMLFLGVRNYAVSGRWVFLPSDSVDIGNIGKIMKIIHPIPQSIDISGIEENKIYNFLRLNNDTRMYVEYLLQNPIQFSTHYLKNLLFCFGFNFLIDPNYRCRPHWMIMWIGYFFYLCMRFIKRKKMQLWETSVHLYIWCSLGTLILFAQIGSYGFRFLIPITNFILLFSFLAWDKLLTKYKRINHIINR